MVIPPLLVLYRKQRLSFEEEAISFTNNPVDWNEGGDSCRNSTSGKSIYVAASLPHKLVGAVPLDARPP